MACYIKLYKRHFKLYYVKRVSSKLSHSYLKFFRKCFYSYEIKYTDVEKRRIIIPVNIRIIIFFMYPLYGRTRYIAK